MGRSTRRIVTIVGMFAVGALGISPVLAAPGSYHQDDRLGYKVRYPKGWAETPLNPEERWIVAKFVSDRAYTFTDPSDGSTYDHKPGMTVIAFVTEIVKKRGASVTEEKGGDVFVEFNNPFTDYKDFLKRTYGGGGWYVSAEEEGELEGVKVTKYEIKVEKLTIPKRIVTWVFHTDDVEIAVEFEVFEAHYDKLKADVQGCLKSFRLVPRTKGSLVPTTTGEKQKVVVESKLTPAERADHRRETEQQAHGKAIAALPAGWTSKDMGRFLVLNHTDEKYAKRVVAHAEAVWCWLDQEFAYLGKGEYIRRPILRICKDADEERAFMSGTTWGNALEIVTHEDKGSGAMSFEFEWVNRRLVDLWFAHRAPGLMYALPYWIDNGLHQVLGTARSKGSTLEFKVDDWERDGLRETVRAGTLTPIKELVMLGAESFYEQQHRSKEAAAFVRFLLASKKHKEVLERYVRAVNEVVVEQQKADDAKQGENAPEEKEPQTEEEEEEQLKQRREAWKQREKELLQKAFDAAFPGWDDKAFKRLDDEYRKSL